MILMCDPETLRLYASIFEKPKREFKGGPLLPPTEICTEATRALRFMANVIENEPAIAQYYSKDLDK